MIIKSPINRNPGQFLPKARHGINLALLLCSLILLSSFSATSEQSFSFSKRKDFPPDTISGIDHELKELMLKEFKLRQIKDSLIAYAKTFEGRPYRYGAKGPKSFDCSGYVKFVYKHFGQDLERTSRAQSHQGEEIPLDMVQKGDLLFFTGANKKNRRVGHVGIVISEADESIRFIHAASHGGVRVSELDSYYQPRLLLAKRLLSVETLGYGTELAGNED